MFRQGTHLGRCSLRWTRHQQGAPKKVKSQWYGPGMKWIFMHVSCRYLLWSGFKNKTKVICANSLEKNWGLGEVAWETVLRVWKRMSRLRTDRHTCEVSAIILWKKELAIIFYLRLLMRCDSCSLSGFLALIIRDVFILELLTCVWKCEFPQVPICSKCITYGNENCIILSSNYTNIA